MEVENLSLCTFCGRDVYNRCIHQSQVKYCNQKAILSASEVYGHYETEKAGLLVERGIGPIQVTEPMEVTRDFISFTRGDTVTRVSLSGLSINQ